MTRLVALIDGEHYPPVVRAALDSLSAEHEVLAAVFAGGTEKIGPEARFEQFGLPVVFGETAEEALSVALERYRPEAVVDLSDEPVVSSSDRFRLASVALGSGAEYRGADFWFLPPVAAAVTRTPALSVVGTGKRVGKTAISAHVARLLKGDGHDIAVLAMGRGGPASPEVIHGDRVALTTDDLLELARTGVHAASDNYEDAVMARVTTVGCRRCGGGMAGSVLYSNVPEGAIVADALGKDLLILEGSGSAVPPVAADAVILVVGAAQGLQYVTGYFGPLRLAAADLVIVAGCEEPFASPSQIQATRDAIRTLRPDVDLVEVTFRPKPIGSVSGKRVFFATTAPERLMPSLIAELESGQGCSVVGSSAHLSDRALLMRDLDAAAGTFDILLTELKAAAIDVVADAGEQAGVPTVLCDNVPVPTSGDLEDAIRCAASKAVERGAGRSGDA